MDTRLELKKITFINNNICYDKQIVDSFPQSFTLINN
jgi:hypothetical protein